MSKINIKLFHGDQNVNQRFADNLDSAKKHAGRMLKDYLDFESVSLPVRAIAYDSATGQKLWESATARIR